MVTVAHPMKLMAKLPCATCDRPRDVPPSLVTLIVTFTLERVSVVASVQCPHGDHFLAAPLNGRMERLIAAAGGRYYFVVED